MSTGIPNPKDVTEAAGMVPRVGEGPSKEPDDQIKSFSSYMKGGQPNPLMGTGQSTQVSPFDLAHGKVPPPGPTLASIQEQAKVAQGTMGDISNQLNTPKLKLKQSTKYLLKNKLSSANGHIQSAAGKLGAPIVGDEEKGEKGGPLQKFVNLVTSGQRQLDATQQMLAQISAKGEQMSPADMLMLQIKLNKAQQELEYSSLLLGKAIDDLKMMMNIQL
ncbi:MAG: hypothetical protein JSS30_06405 [Verrucomicrobia bacterium]|nr:hypothetical protein [Verrucomicrobiota bacterium]